MENYMYICILVVLKRLYMMLEILYIMSVELNHELKKEIKLKQSKLRVLLEVDALNVDKKEDIVNYTLHEKSKLVTDIINMLDITELDQTFFDEGFQVNCTIESLLKHIGEVPNYRNQRVTVSIYEEFVFKLAYGDIDELLGFDVFNSYLKMLSVVSSCYDDIPSDQELKIEV